MATPDQIDQQQRVILAAKQDCAAMHDRIQSRRAALQAQLDQTQQQHTELQAIIRQLEHSISAMQGGLQEIDALLEGGDVATSP